MGVFFAFIGACFAGFHNYFLRRSIDAGGTSRGFFLAMLVFSSLIVILLNPVMQGNYTFSLEAVLAGLSMGFFLGLFYFTLGKSFETGPVGLSVAIINTSSVVPALVLALIFGAAFGHPYTLWNGVGSLIVVLGFFILGRSRIEAPNLAHWVLIVSLAFLSHVLYLILLQWWDMILNPALPRSSLIPFYADSDNCCWFTPFLFIGAALLHWGVFFSKPKMNYPISSEWLYGICGGVVNGLCMYFLILATQYADGWENAVIFPVFSVGIIVVTNTWSHLLYKEQVNWIAITTCVVGISIATISFGGETSLENVVSKEVDPSEHRHRHPI
jgi:drug/metabolite transporter (DMT)-like permease